MIHLTFLYPAIDSGGELWFHIGVCVSVHPSLICPSVFLFLDDNAKLGMCIDTTEIRFWFADGQILSILKVICP